MAKLLIACDEYIYKYKGEYYAGSQEKFEFFKRYLRVFESIRLICRIEEEEILKESRVSLGDDSRIEVVPVPMFHGPVQYAKSYFAVGKAVNRVVDGCDGAILRIPSTVAIRVSKQVLKSGIPYACEVVYDAEDGWRGHTGLSHYAWKRIDKQMRRLCANADGVSCVTEHYLQRHYFSNKNNAFTEHYSSLDLKKSFYGSPQKHPQRNPFIIAHISNQVGEQSAKGHKQTIQAVKILKDRGINVIVKFAGNDYFGGVELYSKYAHQLGVDKNVEFVGYLNREGVETFLSEADMFVMPTKAEGLPRVIIEAMAKGLPCVTTPVSGNPELVQEYFLVDYDDIEKLADRIEELIKGIELYERTSRENFEKSLEYESSILEKRRDVFYTKLKLRSK